MTKWIVMALFSVLLVGVPSAFAGGDWNEPVVAWKAYDEALVEAKRTGKPICLVFYTEWCPHCTNYSKVFHDPKVVARSGKFVMVRIDKDKNPELSRKFAPDGEYIPRTYFLSSKGELDASIHAPREKYRYFYDEADPASVLAGMQQALDKLAK
ncbi:MAG: thioredoxin family protein [Myxococcota bacterium]|nr:thioredoxin family protein [Myxococcota bacterium]